MATNSSDVDAQEWRQWSFESLADGVIVADNRGRTVTLNAAAEDLLGVKRDETVGTPVRSLLTLQDRDTEETVRVPSSRAFYRGPSPRHYEKLMVTGADKRKVTIDFTAAPVKGYRGTVKGCLYVLRDVSAAAAREHQALERQKLEAIGSMAGNMAHDFISWLSVISSHALSIADNLIPKTRAHDEALRIVEAARHASGLTRRLLTIARASRPENDAKAAIVDIHRAVEEATELARASFASQTIEFRTHNLENVSPVKADSDQLVDCLVNLFRNSVEAFEGGSGVITVDAVHRTRGNDEWVVLRVRDSGEGIPRDITDRILEPFFTTKKARSAVGLGLTVVNGSVQQWGGALRVRSMPGRGTTVRLFLPRAEVDAKSALTPGQTGGETVLLVDDQESLLNETRTILRDAGYHVHAATNARECLDLYKRHRSRIQLAIIDVVMPGRDGKRILAEILEIEPTAAIIMTSGFPRDYIRAYLERGAWEFLQKPFEQAHLLDTVRRVLENKTT